MIQEVKQSNSRETLQQTQQNNAATSTKRKTRHRRITFR